MTVEIFPSKASGRIKAPASKSMAHRLLICAALCDGTSTIRGISESEDILATIDCLRSLGAVCEINGDTVTVTGKDMLTAMPSGTLHCRESGSTLRFLIPIALACGRNTVFDGSSHLLSRPLNVYEEMCSEKGMLFSQDAGSVVVKGPLKAGEYRVPGNISSQFISGLLFALPLLNEDSTVTVLPPVESGSYIDLTVRALEIAGVTIERPSLNILKIKGNSRYRPIDVTVEGDYSNAAFLSAFNYTGGNVIIDGLDPDSLQGDKIYSKYFESISRGTPSIHIGDCPDLGPVMFALSASKYGGVYTGTRRLRIKESDRAEAMAEELRKFGVSVTVGDDSVVIYPKEFHAPDEVLNSHNDHRIVMALAVLCSITGGKIAGAEAVRKSYPDFFERISDAGIKVVYHED
ncbi:MAG: 3-phosphoshikimate 1-carboxyvinyltransferase [Clostridia bacterium]|nr:3-phosphoshikimate 1-carboxyvinyltransferase [Clostridia bacterium]